ncbi:CRAL-TRIO domain-containing protein [Dichotomopilus funicola]|uniref:CRAL-TRIO domain-containing protein n=1 Tax=Dichotomopilus funicola TaxID=1934379 RepID=A0AAN6ZLY3_9PEZI|nr:CRAL-TRIO domain-containing protein [Dichotomopilus funicola]
MSTEAAGPLKFPLLAPTPESKPKPRPVLTEQQQQKYDSLLTQAKSWTEIPIAQDGKPTTTPVTEVDKLWLTRDCLLRYLRATKWDEPSASKRLLETLAWRHTYGVNALTPEQISPENETGKQIILGFDKEARVCHYLSPGRQNTEASPRQVQHLVFMLERVIDLMPAGQETLALLINFQSSKSRSNTAPNLSMAREVLNILQHHYPERLGKALIINMPWIVTGFFRLITPFIDPNTREKLKFNEDMAKYVPVEQMWSEFSTGKLEFEYDHEVYWPALQALCEEKREARRERWVKGGSQIGESEDYLAGASEVGVAGVQDKAEKEVKDEKGAGEEEKKPVEGEQKVVEPEVVAEKTPQVEAVPETAPVAA